jgi:hypothetical protein
MIKPMCLRILSVGVIVACFYQLGICAEKEKIDGWQAAKFGMPPAQISLAFPGATEDTSLCKSPPPDLENDCALLFLKRYEGFGREWSVGFVFSKGTRLLQRVMLGGPSGDELTMQKQYADLKTILKQQYGVGTEILTDDEKDCEKVARRLAQREVVRKYEFYASHKGVRYTIDGVGGKLRLYLNSDPVCSQAPKEISHGQPNIALEYVEAGSDFGSP